MVEQLVEVWRINHRVTLKVLDGLPPEALQATLSKRGGRDIARQFAHVHDVKNGLVAKTRHPRWCDAFRQAGEPARGGAQESTGRVG